MELDNKLEHLRLIQKWLAGLWSNQKELISQQVMHLLPTDLVDCGDYFARLNGIIERSIASNEWIKVELLRFCLKLAIEYQLSDYPTTPDEYLDWYQKRKNALSIGLKKSEDDLRANQIAGDLQSTHFNSMKHALTTWEELDQKFEQEEEGI